MGLLGVGAVAAATPASAHNVSGPQYKNSGAVKFRLSYWGYNSPVVAWYCPDAYDNSTCTQRQSYVPKKSKFSYTLGASVIDPSFDTQKMCFIQVDRGVRYEKCSTFYLRVY